MTSMRELSRTDQNMTCADCDAREPTWTSINLGIFLCITCAGHHRNLGVHHSKVRSIDLDTQCWDPETISFMESTGNVRAREKYEYNAPCFYVRTTESASPVVRENWIRAKYVRKEFVKEAAADDDDDNGGGGGEAKDASHPAVYSMPEPAREGFLSKLNRKDKWQQRWYLLHGRFLFWFKNPSDSYPQNQVDVTTVRVVVPDKPLAGHRYTFEVHAPKKTYPLCADKEEDMFSWIHAIRRAALFYGKLRKGGDEEEKERSADKSKTFKEMGKVVREGTVTKQGGQWKSWRERWCVLANGALYYFKKRPSDSDTPEGGVGLDFCDITDGEVKTKKKHCLSLITPNRTYFLQLTSVQEALEWKRAIRGEIDRLAKRVRVDFKKIKA